MMSGRDPEIARYSQRHHCTLRLCIMSVQQNEHVGSLGQLG